MLLLQVNRATALFEKAARRYNDAFGNKVGNTVFSYWCTFYGENPNADSASISLPSSGVYNQLESKTSVLKLLRKHAVKNVFPAGYTSVTEALNHPEPVQIWFSKPGHLSGGRGIQVISRKSLHNYMLPQFHLLQAGVENLSLITGKKFTARIYVLLWNKQVFLFDDGFVLIHGTDYVPGSTDYSVQVDHHGYEREDSNVKMRLCSDNVLTGSIVSGACKPLRRMLPILMETLAATSQSKYLILGIDALMKTNGSIKFIEINAIPNFVHNRRVNELLNIPMLEHVMRITTGCYSHRFKLITPKNDL